MARPNPQRFDSFLPNSLFLNQNYLSAGFPIGFQPFGYPQGKNFVYAYSQQSNLTVERDLGDGFDFSLAYNFNGGRHLNRPINANATRGDLMVKNFLAAAADGQSLPVRSPSRAAPRPELRQPFVDSSLMNFFRPVGL